MRYVDMSSDEIKRMIKVYLEEIRKACEADNLELVIIANGKENGWIQCINMEGGAEL